MYRDFSLAKNEPRECNQLSSQERQFELFLQQSKYKHGEYFRFAFYLYYEIGKKYYDMISLKTKIIVFVLFL